MSHVRSTRQDTVLVQWSAAQESADEVEFVKEPSSGSYRVRRALECIHMFKLMNEHCS